MRYGYYIERRALCTTESFALSEDSIFHTPANRQMRLPGRLCMGLWKGFPDTQLGWFNALVYAEGLAVLPDGEIFNSSHKGKPSPVKKLIPSQGFPLMGLLCGEFARCDFGAGKKPGVTRDGGPLGEGMPCGE